MGSESIAKTTTSENVIVVVIDGPRYSETWGDPSQQFIPNLFQRLSPKGVVNYKFYNHGDTHTLSGHTNISRGIYEGLENTGRQYPQFPSYLQHWLYQTHSSPSKAWIIGSKTKLEILGNCTNGEWSNSYLPSVDTKNRPDIETYQRVTEVLNEHHPNLVFINLRGPDWGGHAHSWELYLKGIRETDSILGQVYDFIERDSVYHGKTTLIMTNDHGRHLDGIRDGFLTHGDHCLGCTHINFYAFGPDIKTDELIGKPREQVDIAPTVAYLMGFKMLHTEGEIMTEILKN